MVNKVSKPTYITKTKIPGFLVINRPLFGDNRGFFREVFRLDDLVRAFVKGKTPRSVIGGLKPSKELANRNWREALGEFISVLKDQA